MSSTHGDLRGRIIHFNDDTHEDVQIPSAQDIEQMKEPEVRELAEIMAYALTHGSGANVKLAFPFAYACAALCTGDPAEHFNLVRQLEQEGQDTRFGTVTVNWT